MAPALELECLVWVVEFWERFLFLLSPKIEVCYPSHQTDGNSITKTTEELGDQQCRCPAVPFEFETRRVIKWTMLGLDSL